MIENKSTGMCKIGQKLKGRTGIKMTLKKCKIHVIISLQNNDWRKNIKCRSLMKDLDWSKILRHLLDHQLGQTLLQVHCSLLQPLLGLIQLFIKWTVDWRLVLVLISETRIHHRIWNSLWRMRRWWRWKIWWYCWRRHSSLQGIHSSDQPLHVSVKIYNNQCMIKINSWNL